MNFFKPVDFNVYLWAFFKDGKLIEKACEEIAKQANAKLEREGKVVYTHSSFEKPGYWGPIEQGQFDNTHKALLINVEPIEKCKHPAEKIGIYYADINDRLKDFVPNFKCECGAKVRPKEFEEIDR